MFFLFRKVEIGTGVLAYVTAAQGFSNGKNVVQTEKDLKRLFPKRCWNKLHLQIIYYGREYCKARECYGLTCKICTSCYPNRKKPIKTKKA